MTPATASGTIMRMFGDGNLLYFMASIGGGNGDELCISDGTPSGTQLLKDINPGTPSSSPMNFAKLGTNVLFTANGVSGIELYTTNGTSAGTSLLKDINPYGNSSPSNLCVLNNKVLFYANDSTHGIEPWVTDGTIAGTQILVDITVGSANTNQPLSFVVANGKAFFGGGGQFWFTDGTPAGSSRFMNAYAPSTSSSNALCVRGGNRVYFIVRNNSFSMDIWSTTTGYDTIRHTYYSTTATNFTNIFPAYSALLVIWKTTVDQLRNLWKLDYDICSPGANITGALSLTCNNHQTILSAGNFDLYNWNTGATSAQISISTPGTYSVTVYDTIVGCISNDTVSVSLLGGTSNVTTPQICEVTVDSITGKNLIMWNKFNDRSGEDFFTIEKETGTNVFTPLVTIRYDSLSIYIDTSANPQVTSYRYRLLLSDSCGNTSVPSNAHQTVHLSQNTGLNGEVNLVWNAYAGTSYTQINVLRRINGAAWNVLNTLPGNVVSYSDISPPSGNLYYMIEVIIDSVCDPSRAVSAVYSNKVDYISTGLAIPTDNSVRIYPNPVTSTLYITVDHNLENTKWVITDLAGQLLKTIDFSHTTSVIENVNCLPSGIYLLSPVNRGMRSFRFSKQ